MRPGKKTLTGTEQATTKAAALEAVPGGTVYRVETDADGATYEAHMTKADGTYITVKFDKGFALTAIQNNIGAVDSVVPAPSARSSLHESALDGCDQLWA